MRSVLGALALLSLAFSAQAGGLEQLRQFIDGTRSARASFQQIVTATSGRKPQQASGSMSFQRPGKFRWAYDKPYYQLLVGDGDTLWIYDKDLNQVTVKKQAQALSSTPAALLAGSNEFQRNFAIKDIGSDNGLEWVEAVPREAEGGFESVRLGFAEGKLRSMVLRDNLGHTTTLTFSAMERNPTLEPSQFRFAVPAGADVVGDTAP